MDVSARDIEQVEFHDAWRGYNQGEVDDFLDQVGETVERLVRENDALRARLQEIETSVESARVGEEMMKKTLLAAERTAQEMVAEAQEEAERIVSEASVGLSGRKTELETTLASLHRFETETKERLREVLEAQLEALDRLNEHPRAEAPVSTPAPDLGHTEPEAPTEAPDLEEPQTGRPGAIAELAAENRADGPTDETDATETDSSLFDFEGAEGAEAPEEPTASMDDFRPFDDEAALQNRRRRGLFRRRVDDWA